jgi:ABC-type transporter Mla MlaB component
MLRITQRDGCLVVEGRVAGPWVAELSRAAEELLSRADAPRLDLSGVRYVDHAGAELLRELDRRMPVHATGFVIEMLRRTM